MVEYKFPPLELLKRGQGFSETEEKIQETAVRLQKALFSFGIESKILNVFAGVRYTRYEIQMAAWVRVKKILQIKDDLKLILAADDIHIVAPIPGKSTIGIDVANVNIGIVTVGDIICTDNFLKYPSPMAVAVGHGMIGNPIIEDMRKMPSLLISGTVGTGKSVCINSLIVSLLYKSTPENIRMILIDTKAVNMGMYNGIPHLLIPVVTDTRKALGALNWVNEEIEDRNRKFSECGIRNFMEYNAKIDALYVPYGDEIPGKLADVVIIIDDFSDLMMAYPKETADIVTKITARARNTGIHLIISTQRPSAKILTGAIKANITNRMAFQVVSVMDSMVILDEKGAEKLQGNGDMLFRKQGEPNLIRVQGAYVLDSEITNIVYFLKNNY